MYIYYIYVRRHASPSIHPSNQPSVRASLQLYIMRVNTYIYICIYIYVYTYTYVHTDLLTYIHHVYTGRAPTSSTAAD